jgi:N utilization substance protein A
MAITSANQLELLQTAEAVAREKMIDAELVIQAMEDSLARAAKSRYGAEMDIRVKIDRKTGRASFARIRTVVEDDAVENHHAQLTVKQAKSYLADPQLGDEVIDEVPPVDLGRIAAQSAKQVILQKVREAERDRQYEEFRDRKGTIINGQVKREEYGNVIVDIGRGEAILRRNEKIGREAYRPGDRIRCYIKDVRREPRGPQVFLSRTDPQFMAELFKMEVPEIYDGIIEIKAVARDPGSRAKIAVISYDNSIDPVGACVGMRGSRVQAVVNELQGEKIDIIQWTPDVASFVVNALAPAEVTKVVLDEESERIEVVVPDEQLSLAIGRRGQNVRLASQLSGWDIDIMTEAEESERRQKEFAARTELFVAALDVDETLAQLLASEGFATVEEVAYVELREIASIEGLDEQTAEELQSRARDYLDRQAQELDARRLELGVLDELKEIEGLTPAMLVALGEAGIKSVEDLAGCATDELIGWTERKAGGAVKHKGAFSDLEIGAEEANDFIMKARISAGWIEAPAEPEGDAEAGEVNA